MCVWANSGATGCNGAELRLQRYMRIRAGGNAGTAHRPHILVKTHAWSDDWDPNLATHIFLTHRDLRGVLASYHRVGWAFDITPAYVADHMRWRVRCSASSPCKRALLVLQKMLCQTPAPATTIYSGGCKHILLIPPWPEVQCPQRHIGKCRNCYTVINRIDVSRSLGD